MTNGNSANHFVNAVGFVVDRVGQMEMVLSSAWLVDADKVVTTADSVQNYVRHPAALEILFTSAARRFGVKKIVLHPQFKQRWSTRTLEQAASDASPFSAVISNNCAILYLDENIVDLTDTERSKQHDELSLKLRKEQQGLSGTLQETEFLLVLRSLMAEKRQGELAIVDDRNHPLAQVFFEEGRISSARYRHLTNELAIRQIVAQKMKNSFYFRQTKRPSWPARECIAMPSEALLAECQKKLDELDRLRAKIGDIDTFFMRRRGESELEQLPPEMHDIGRAIWSVADGLTPASCLWYLVNLDDWTIFKTLPVLSERGLLIASESAWQDAALPSSGASADRKSLSPLAVAPKLSLSANDLMTSLIIDPATFRNGLKHGQLLGSIDAFDSYRLIHNLPMLPEHAGCPIFKNGYVVAMHVGALPANPQVSLPVLQQCLWVQSILDCLLKAGETEVVKRLTGSVRTPAMTPAVPSHVGAGSSHQVGCVEVANIACPRCAASSFHSARVCEKCGFEFIPAETVQKHGGQFWRTAVAIAVVAIVGALAAAIFVHPEANLAPNSAVYLSRQPWLTVGVKQANLKLGMWEEQAADKVYKNGDTIHLMVDVLKPCYIYLVHQTNDGVPSLIYPHTEALSKVYSPGVKITFPEQIEEKPGSKATRMSGMTFAGAPGTETIIGLASKHPLNLNRSQPVPKAITENAARVYGWGRFPIGFEMEQSTLFGTTAGQGDQSAKANESDDENIIYVTRLVASHKQ